MEGVTSTRMAIIGTWTVPVLGRARELNIIMPKIQGGEKLGGGTKNSEMGVLRSWVPKHIVLAIGRKKQTVIPEREQWWFRALSFS